MLIDFRAWNRRMIGILCAGAMASAAFAQPELLDRNRRDLLHEALSGERAKDHVIQITRHHRIQGSRGYRQAAQYVLAQLHSAGFSEQNAFIESYPSDGRVTYQTWQSPSGWDITRAELRMLEPFEERLVEYPEIAMSLITYSNPGDVTAELVWVGSGTRDSDYAGKDVRGKFVLATGYGGAVHRLAVLKYGARAVVCYLDDDRARHFPDMLQYTGMWPRTEELERVTFGFNLTNRQGEKLRRLLEAGEKVVLRGFVEGIGLEPYEMDVVVATIPGTIHADEELVFSAHLDHPKESANDNASGSAAILDIAQTLRRLIDTGRLPEPQRTLRFLWVPEWYGTMAYIDRHPELRGPALGGKVLANLNLDMVGEHLELLHSKLILTRTPDSVPSILHDVVENMAEMVDRMEIRTPRGSLSAFNYRVTPYSGGSDHMMFIDRKIPAMMFSHSPDYTHHTSEDTPDKVDPVELERCEIIATATMLYLSDLNTSQAMAVAGLVAGKAAGRLGEVFYQGMQQRSAANGGAHVWLTDAYNRLQRALQRERAALMSLFTFHRNQQLENLVKQLADQMQQQVAVYEQALQGMAAPAGTTATAQPISTQRRDERIPVRLTRGPLDFSLPQSKLPQERAAWYARADFPLDGARRFELVNFIDGRHSVTQIRDALSAEFGPVELEVVSRYVEDLVAIGVVRWKG